MQTTVFLLLALIIILVNAFFVFAEISLVKVRSTRLQEMADEGNASARLALEETKNIENYLSAVQLGVTMASLALGWVGEPSAGAVLDKIFPSIFPFLSAKAHSIISFACAFLFITSLHVIFGEQVPRFIAIRYPDTVALIIARPLHYFQLLTKWPIKFLVWAAKSTIRLFGIDPDKKEDAPSEEEIRLIFNESQQSGEFSLRRSLMFENLFDFKKEHIGKIMTPRDKIAAIKKGTPWAQVLQFINTRRFSRYPLFTNTIDDAKEYIMVKEISLDYMSEGGAVPDIHKYSRPLINLGENTSLEVALKEFQTNKIHAALVKNRAGRVLGLVTLEDVLEELVGEIRDEKEHTPVLELSKFFVPAATILNITDTDKFAAYAVMVRALHAARPVFDEARVRQLVFDREKLLSCSLERGVAFPHARVENLAAPLISFAYSKPGVPFCEGDKHPVKIFFLILVPMKTPILHLQILAQLSALLANKTARTRLSAAKTPEEAAEVILAFENIIAL